jgi:hypothetical protein
MPTTAWNELSAVLADGIKGLVSIRLAQVVRFGFELCETIWR